MEEENFQEAEKVEIQRGSFLGQGEGEQGEAQGAGSNIGTGTFGTGTAKWILKILIFLMPIFFLPFTFDVLELNKQALMVLGVSLAAILWLGEGIRKGSIKVASGFWLSGSGYRKYFNIYTLVLLITLVGVLASVFSLHSDRSIFGASNSASNSLVSLLSFVFFFFLAVSVFERNEISSLLRIFKFSILLAVLFSLLQLYGAAELIKNPAFNTVGSLNSLGLLAVLGMVLALLRSDLKRLYLARFLNILMMIAGLFLLVILNFWVLWLVLMVGILSALIFNVFQGSYKIKDLTKPLVIIAIAVLMLISSINVRTGAALPIEISPSFKASVKIARDTILERPVLGLGQENFVLAYDKYKPEAINNTVFWNFRFSDAVSEIFNTFIMYGLSGGILMLGFLIWLLYLVFKNRSQLGPAPTVPSGPARDITSGPALITAVIAYLLYPLNMTLMFGFWLLAGLLILDSARDDNSSHRVINLEESPFISVLTSVVFVAVLVLSIAGIYFMEEKYRADIYFNQASNTQDSEEATQLMVKAINTNPREDLYSRALSNLLLTRVNDELAKQQGPEASKLTPEERNAINTRLQNFITAAVDLTNRTVTRHPHDSSNWFNRGFVLQNLVNLIQGADNSALASYDEFMKLSPRDPLGPARKGIIYFNRAEFVRQLLVGTQGRNLKEEDRKRLSEQVNSDMKAAEDNFKESIGLKGDFALANYNLSAVYERQGKIKAAIKQLESVRTSAPQDAGVAFQLSLLYYRNNQKDEAFNEMLRAVAVFPNYSNARWYLALMLEERGRIDEAIAVLNRVQELNPDNQDIAKKISDLKAGKREIPPQKVTGKEPLEERREER